MVFSQQPEWPGSTDLVEILGCRPHLLPGLVQQLDADPKELLKGSVVGEEHRVVVIAPFVCCGGQTVSAKPLPSGTQGTHLTTLTSLHSSIRTKNTDHGTSRQGAEGAFLRPLALRPVTNSALTHGTGELWGHLE